MINTAMAKLEKLLIIFFLLVSLVPAWYVNRWLQRVIQPRRSFVQLLLYMVGAMVLVFAYTFLIVFIIYRLFPLPTR